ncbi:hypothetical protein [Asticcacaulis solisilvae]|uniref:hypothetical protein n=1 Tax=Asticcacaulis solisilvae TaxID=1217274 RepID=UPI003FD8AAA2
MDILVVVPSAEHLKTAGVRIRYTRLQSALKELGHSLKIRPIAGLTSPDALKEDVFLISKVYDTRALLLMRALKARNKIVGVDFFDNYFTHPENARLVRTHDWAVAAAGLMDFALCATGKMKSLLATELLNDKPCHVVNDPYEKFEPGYVSKCLTTKIERTRLTGRLHLGWFGIGNNPYFPVGLADLFTYKDHLTAFRTCGYDVHLTIMSNMLAQSSQTHAMLSQLNLPYSLEEWSEEREKALIEKCLVCFLPVSGQSFSVVKSPNRAISAFSHGAQVLSVGFPLYTALAPFVYRSAADIVADLDADRLALRPDTVGDLAGLLENQGSPATEARALSAFLTGLADGRTPRRRGARRELAAVVQGRQSPVVIEKYVRTLDHLTVSSPFSSADQVYDVKLSFAGPEPAFHLSAAAVKALLPKFTKSLEPLSARKDGPQALPLAAVVRDGSGDFLEFVRNDHLASVIALYGPAMSKMADFAKLLFGDIPVYFSEWEAPLRVEQAERYAQARPRRATEAGETAATPGAAKPKSRRAGRRPSTPSAAVLADA